MNQTNTIEGGWPNTFLRSTLNENLLSTFPSELTSVITGTKTYLIKIEVQMNTILQLINFILLRYLNICLLIV